MSHAPLSGTGVASGAPAGSPALPPAGHPPAAVRLELIELPLDRIVTDEAERDPSDALREDFERDGGLGAIEVRARPDGLYDLVDGSRRLGCARERGQRTIAAIVEPAEAALLSRNLRALLLNTQRQNLQQLHIGIRARRLIEEEGWTQAELARRLHRSRSALCAMVKVADSPDLVAAVKEGLAFGAARALVALAAEERRPLLEALTEAQRREGHFPTVREVEALVRRRRSPAELAPVSPESAPALLERLGAEGTPLEIRIVRGRRRAVTLTIVLTDEDPLLPAALPEEAPIAVPLDPGSAIFHGETPDAGRASEIGGVFSRCSELPAPAGGARESVAT